MEGGSAALVAAGTAVTTEDKVVVGPAAAGAGQTEDQVGAGSVAWEGPPEAATRSSG